MRIIRVSSWTQLAQSVCEGLTALGAAGLRQTFSEKLSSLFVNLERTQLLIDISIGILEKMGNFIASLKISSLMKSSVWRLFLLYASQLLHMKLFLPWLCMRVYCTLLCDERSLWSSGDLTINSSRDRDS